VRKDLGLVTQVFSEADLAAMPGKVAIGHCRYGTAGAKGWESAQPHLSMINDVIIALAHNGTLVNFDALRAELIEMGIPFRSSTDSEVAAKLIGYFTQRGHRLRTGIAHTMRMLEGGYAMVLARENALYAFRDPHGIRPLVLGKLGRGRVGRCLRDLRPGHCWRHLRARGAPRRDYSHLGRRLSLRAGRAAAAPCRLHL
jgi:amidophosphoribosyltransferase